MQLEQRQHRAVTRVAPRGASSSLRNRDRRDFAQDVNKTSSAHRPMRHAHSTSSVRTRVLPPISGASLVERSRAHSKRAPEPVLAGVMASRAPVASESETDDVTLSPGSECELEREAYDVTSTVGRAAVTMETASTQTPRSQAPVDEDRTRAGLDEDFELVTSSPTRCDVITPFYWDGTESNIIISITAPPPSEPTNSPSPKNSPAHHPQNPPCYSQTSRRDTGSTYSASKQV